MFDTLGTIAGLAAKLNILKKTAVLKVQTEH